MNNDETKHHMIVRTINSDNLPDVENYIRTLHEKGFFAQLIKEEKFTVEEIKKLPFGKLCDIFFREEGQKIKNGDIRIFKDTGDYTINVHTG